MHRTLSSFALVLFSLSCLPAQSVTLTSDETLRIHFSIPSVPSPAPDVLQYGIGIVTVNAPFGSRTSRLWDCEELLGTAASTSFGSHSGALSLGVNNSWAEAGSLWNFDSPGIVPSFAPLQNATIDGIIDFEIATGSITLDLSNVSMQLVRATSSGGGSVASPGPVIDEVVVVPKLTGPVPATVGTTNTWSMTGCVPGSPVLYAFGFGCSPVLLPFATPVYFDLSAPVVTFTAISDPSGASSFGFPIPLSAMGNTLMTQGVEVNLPDFRISNFTRVDY